MFMYPSSINRTSHLHHKFIQISTIVESFVKMAPHMSARKEKKPANKQEKTTRDKEEAKNRRMLEKEAASKAKAKKLKKEEERKDKY